MKRVMRLPAWARRAALAVGVAALGCSLAVCDGPSGDLAQQCGLSCPDEGIRDGKASISGVIEFDAFFGALIDSQSAAASVRDGIRADLNAIALSVGLELDVSAEEIAAAVAERIARDTAGGLELVFSEPQCQASVEVAALAAGACEPQTELDALELVCEGTCSTVSDTGECGSSATLICEGTAPGLQCDGTCTGECSLEVAGSCDGICRGTCNGSCSVQDAQGSCAGACAGTCQGTCELEAGGTCEGECQGTCSVDSDGACSAGQTSRCRADAGATVACEARCEGIPRATVSSVCEATVRARAGALVDCAPAKVTMRWQWSSTAAKDVEAQASFRAWVEVLSAHAASARSKGVKGDIIINGFHGMNEALGGTLGDAIVEAARKGDLKAKIGAGCALGEFDDAALLIEAGTDTLLDSVADAAIVLDALQ